MIPRTPQDFGATTVAPHPAGFRPYAQARAADRSAPATLATTAFPKEKAAFSQSSQAAFSK
jgi:hypothetical protein